MAPYKRKNKKTRTPKRKAAATQNTKRTLSDYILTLSDIGSLHSLSDTAKILHGFDTVDFIVENASDTVENEETRKQTAKVVRKIKLLRPGLAEIRKTLLKGKKPRGLHIQVVELTGSIAPAVPTTPILEDEELSSIAELDDTCDTDDEYEDSITVCQEVKNPGESRMQLKTPTPTLQCEICFDWLDTDYEKRVHQWDKYGIRQVRIEKQGQFYSCGSKI